MSSDYPEWKGTHIGPPYLGSALICESVVEDAPGVTDVRRIYSSALLVVEHGQTKSTLAPSGDELFLWVRLYADDAPGEYEFDVRFISPSGKGIARQTAVSLLTFDGLSAVIPIHRLTTEERGVHHFEVGLDGRLVTKVPFEIEISAVSKA